MFKSMKIGIRLGWGFSLVGILMLVASDEDGTERNTNGPRLNSMAAMLPRADGIALMGA